MMLAPARPLLQNSALDKLSSNGPRHFYLELYQYLFIYLPTRKTHIIFIQATLEVRRGSAQNSGFGRRRESLPD